MENFIFYAVYKVYRLKSLGTFENISQSFEKGNVFSILLIILLFPQKLCQVNTRPLSTKNVLEKKGVATFVITFFCGKLFSCILL